MHLRPCGPGARPLGTMPGPTSHSPLQQRNADRQLRRPSSCRSRGRRSSGEAASGRSAARRGPRRSKQPGRPSVLPGLNWGDGGAPPGTRTPNRCLKRVPRPGLGPAAPEGRPRVTRRLLPVAVRGYAAVAEPPCPPCAPPPRCDDAIREQQTPNAIQPVVSSAGHPSRRESSSAANRRLAPPAQIDHSPDKV